MPSNTTITKARRRIRKRRLGRDSKRERMLAGTPKFPIDPTKSTETTPAE
ncbi:MAG TPA: hypothetical protein VI299_29750 [Polyangiales bacterium]